MLSAYFSKTLGFFKKDLQFVTKLISHIQYVSFNDLTSNLLTSPFPLANEKCLS